MKKVPPEPPERVLPAPAGAAPAFEVPPTPSPPPFLCDNCRIEHPESDLGKNIGEEKNHPGCTGRICKRCTHGGGNRAQRRAMKNAALCRTPCSN